MAVGTQLPISGLWPMVCESATGGLFILNIFQWLGRYNSGERCLPCTQNSRICMWVFSVKSQRKYSGLCVVSGFVNVHSHDSATERPIDHGLDEWRAFLPQTDLLNPASGWIWPTNCIWSAFVLIVLVCVCTWLCGFPWHFSRDQMQCRGPNQGQWQANPASKMITLPVLSCIFYIIILWLLPGSYIIF